MSSRGRGDCSVCGRNMAIKWNGGTHVHYEPGGGYGVCAGAGQPPAQTSLSTEAGAAARLAALLNEIQAAGHLVATGSHEKGLWVGGAFLAEPRLDDGLWEVTEA